MKYYEEPGITIYQGDCLDILPLLDAGSVKLLWTDPPYGHGNHDGDFNARLNNHRGIENKPIANDGMDVMRDVVDRAFELALPLLDPETSALCSCCGGGGGPRPTFAWLASRMDSKGLSFFHSVIWDKVNPGLGWRYRRQHEMVMVAHPEKGKLAWANNDVAVPNVISQFPGRDRQHPNERPLALVERFISWHTQPGDLVLDPFMGGGTTLVAAKNLGRRGVGIELEEHYCDVAIERLGQQVLSIAPEVEEPQHEQESLL